MHLRTFISKNNSINGLKYGYVIQCKNVITVYQLKHNRLHGIYIIRNGIYTEISYYVWGIRHGQIFKFESSRLKEKYSYRNGKKHGAYISYFNKTINEEFQFNRGKIHGQYTRYFPSGIIQCTYEYDNNRLHGECLEYTIDGSLYTYCIYVNNRLHGTYYQFHHTTNTKYLYYNGRVIHQVSYQ